MYMFSVFCFQEADLGMPITITPERYEDFEFSSFFWQEAVGGIIRLESDSSPTIW